MAEGWDMLPFGTQLRLPITASVPMFFRWKIMQIKLLLNDLKYLHDTHKTKWAYQLYKIVQAECEELCKDLAVEVSRGQEKRDKLSGEEAKVHDMET